MVVGQFVQEAQLVVLGATCAGRAAAARAALLGVQTVLVDAGEAAAPFECDGVEVVRGRPHFEGTRDLAVLGAANARIRFRRAIIAIPATLEPAPADWPDATRSWDWAAAERGGTPPEAVVIAGAGAAALELAARFARIGSEVELVTGETRLLPEADEDLARFLDEHLARSGRARVRCGCDVADAVRDAEHAIAAFGRRPDLASLALAAVDVEPRPDGSIAVDERMRTSNPRILAAGDATGEPYSSAKGIAQGRVAAEVCAGRDAVFDAATLPIVVRSEPPVAWCGVTERDAGTNVGIGRVSCKGGMAKVVVEPGSGLLLGAALGGPDADAVIGEAVLAIEMGAVAGDLAGSVRSDTLTSELLTEAARRAAGDR